MTEKGELLGQIVRATSWRELFPSPEAEWADFRDKLIRAAKAEHERYDALKEYRVESLPKGDQHIFEDKNGSVNTYQKLKSTGNVIITFNRPGDSPTKKMVTPAVGNIAHGFTAADTLFPSREFLEQLGNDQVLAVTGVDPMVLTTYIKGKPATPEWEKSMLKHGNLPQRIGHQLYPSFVLEAQARLKKACPQAFSDYSL